MDEDDTPAWNIAFHRRTDDSRLGDVVAYRIDEHRGVYAMPRSLLLLLAEDIPFDNDLDRWRLAITQALHRGTLSDVRAHPSEMLADHLDHRSTRERTYRNPAGSETWWRPRIVHYRGVRIETRIKTMQTTDGRVTAQDAAISITDGEHPRRFSIPVAILDQVISALGIARDDAEAVNLELTRPNDIDPRGHA
ncbi:hypothetical protein [Gordonia sp. (in: high G+C Gram-positive bacteria)]|uniref:hypothetical protein n=1 Tax=Gordonia sp. (in: high G+C Gram-positive bacteria) TaxID=84139 RepID=UPI0033409FE7